MACISAFSDLAQWLAGISTPSPDFVQLLRCRAWVLVSIAFNCSFEGFENREVCLLSLSYCRCTAFYELGDRAALLMIMVVFLLATCQHGVQPAESGISEEGGGSSIANRTFYSYSTRHFEGRARQFILTSCNAESGMVDVLEDDCKQELLEADLGFLSNPTTSSSSSIFHTSFLIISRLSIDFMFFVRSTYGPKSDIFAWCCARRAPFGSDTSVSTPFT